MVHRYYAKQADYWDIQTTLDFTAQLQPDGTVVYYGKHKVPHPVTGIYRLLLLMMNKADNVLILCLIKNIEGTMNHGD